MWAHAERKELTSVFHPAAIYESSCEAYKLMGSSSGFYSVDPDGSGPLGATQVYCNMTGEITVVHITFSLIQEQSEGTVHKTQSS